MGLATLTFPVDLLYARGFALARNTGVFRVGENAVVHASSAIPVSGGWIAGSWREGLTPAVVLFRNWKGVISSRGQEGMSQALPALSVSAEVC